MLKSVIKEIFIILLLSIAILLILGILFYEYIPINKVVPEKEAYTTPEEVKNEINEAITESEKIEVTYEVTDADLNIYKQSGSYSEGKVNPFALESTTEENNTNEENGVKDTNTDNNNNNNNNSDNNNSNTVDKNSTGTFFNDEGIK